MHGLRQLLVWEEYCVASTLYQKTQHYICYYHILYVSSPAFLLFISFIQPQSYYYYYASPCRVILSLLLLCIARPSYVIMPRSGEMYYYYASPCRGILSLLLLCIARPSYIIMPRAAEMYYYVSPFRRSLPLLLL